MNGTVNFRYHSRVRRVTCLEQLGNTGQTTGDITSLTLYTRNLNEDVTCSEFLTILDNHVTAYRQVVRTEHLALGTDDIGRRNLGTVLGLNDDDFLKTCGLIGLDLICYVCNDVSQLDLTGNLSDDEGVERIPCSNQVTLLNCSAALDKELRTVRQVVVGECDACVLVNELDLTQTAYYYLNLVSVITGSINGTNLLELNAAVVLGCQA